VNEYAAALFGKYNAVSPALVQLFPSLQNDTKRFIRAGDFQVGFETNGVEGRIISVSFMGGFYEMEIAVPGSQLIITHANSFRKGDVVYISLK
jgi:hypothetical protein